MLPVAGPNATRLVVVGYSPSPAATDADAEAFCMLLSGEPMLRARPRAHGYRRMSGGLVWHKRRTSLRCTPSLRLVASKAKNINVGEIQAAHAGRKHHWQAAGLGTMEWVDAGQK